ncbi:MAG: TlpA family protein disulfide reductase [Planctomycetes bacterium]|nr:TlpA family protein disulfide reductase [Planctomycetota bacterium]
MDRALRASAALLLMTGILLVGCVKTTPEGPEEDTLPSLAPPVGDDDELEEPVPPPIAPASEDTSAAPAADGEITLEVVDHQGYQQVLDRHKGKVVLVDFWATWCAPCVEKFPHTVHVSRSFPKDQVAVISVSLDDPESREAALEFLQKQEARFDNLLSEQGASVESMEAFDIENGIPHYKIYDREGEVAKTLTPGPDLEVTLELLESEVRQVVEGA